MSDRKGPRNTPDRKAIDAPLPVRAALAGLTGRFERPAIARPAAATSRSGASRHAAISRNLQNYANYKTWAEKVRTSWEPGKDPKG
jgi:hypothetical protein